MTPADGNACHQRSAKKDPDSEAGAKNEDSRSRAGMTSLLLLLQNFVQRRAQMVHVCFVQRLVAVECAVFLHQVDDRNVAGAVSGAEFAIRVLEYRNDGVVLVDEDADVVLLDAAVQTDGNTRKSLGFIFLDEVLNFGEVFLAVRALGAEIVDEQRAVSEMAEHDTRIADARKVLGKVHFHGLFGLGIHH